MKIITLKRMTMDGEPLYVDANNEGCEDPNDWWGVIETKEEELVYDKFVCGNKGLAGETEAEHIWNEMVKHAGESFGLAWGDDDIYGYISPDETVPEIGEEFIDGDGDRWLRVQ